MRPSLKRLLKAVLGLLLILPGAAWAQEGVVKTDGLWLPPLASEEGRQVDMIFNIIFWITLATMVGVFVVMIIFLVKYRHQEGRKALFVHGNHRAETIWTITPAVILVVLGVLSIRVWGALRFNRPDPREQDVTEVEVLAERFQWNIRYPGKDGRFGTPDDIGTFDANDLYKSVIPARVTVPVGKPVLIHLMSRDVLHSFFVPNMRQKLDAVPGMRGPLWFTPTRPGKYDIMCAELCGAQHYAMRGELEVLDQKAYDEWLKERNEQVHAEMEAMGLFDEEEAEEAGDESAEEAEKPEAEEKSSSDAKSEETEPAEAAETNAPDAQPANP